MDRNDFYREQFASLRREIEAQEMRIFWTVIIGLLGIPALTHLVWGAGTLVWLVLPFFVLVFILLFLAQQSQMMRAGRYIREQFEPSIGEPAGWETWLESRSRLRLMDKHFSGAFIIIFFVYYFTAIGMSIQRLWILAADDPSGLYTYFLAGAGATYCIATIWAIATLFWHWRTSMSTSAPIGSVKQ